MKHKTKTRKRKSVKSSNQDLESLLQSIQVPDTSSQDSEDDTYEKIKKGFFILLIFLFLYFILRRILSSSNTTPVEPNKKTEGIKIDGFFQFFNITTFVIIHILLIYQKKKGQEKGQKKSGTKENILETENIPGTGSGSLEQMLSGTQR